MKQYEAMCIVRPDLSEEDRKVLFTQIGDAVTKEGGRISQAAVWADRKKLFFPLKRHIEGVYYLINFTSDPSSIVKIRHTFTLNENILRVLVSSLEE